MRIHLQALLISPQSACLPVACLIEALLPAGTLTDSYLLDLQRLG